MDDAQAEGCGPGTLPTCGGTGRSAVDEEDAVVGRSTARTPVSSQRYGVPVVDPWGGRWLVRWYRAPALGPPEPSASATALQALLDPRWRGRTAPVTEPPPAASWVMGRSAPWQRPEAPGTEDPTLDEFQELRWAMGALSDGVASVGQLVGTGRRMADAARTLRDERTRPWAVELVAQDDARSVLWHAPGPDAAEPSAQAVLAALRAGTLPLPPGAVLMAVRNPRPAPGW